ncbi:MAG TPA: type II toxin-antitoxin system RelE/ParE family toxin [Gammaproteobacteria bacterium]|nr:type II toxin-antitoxin system RelE/ParE family toxin [Gammaproteobacteria bacterium]
MQLIDDAYRLRVGDYRILYVILNESKEIEIIAIGHRQGMYQ